MGGCAGQALGQEGGVLLGLPQQEGEVLVHGLLLAAVHHALVLVGHNLLHLHPELAHLHTRPSAAAAAGADGASIWLS